MYRSRYRGIMVINVLDWEVDQTRSESAKTHQSGNLEI